MFIHVASGEGLPRALCHRALRQPGEPARVAFDIVGLSQGSLDATGDAGRGSDCLDTFPGSNARACSLLARRLARRARSRDACARR
eukprot:210671-Chlamydomonas_euryale.AAC.1